MAQTTESSLNNSLKDRLTGTEIDHSILKLQIKLLELAALLGELVDLETNYHRPSDYIASNELPVTKTTNYYDLTWFRPSDLMSRKNDNSGLTWSDGTPLPDEDGEAESLVEINRDTTWGAWPTMWNGEEIENINFGISQSSNRIDCLICNDIGWIPSYETGMHPCFCNQDSI